MGKYATINPATGEVVQGFDTMSDADADHALTRAHQAYLDWRNIELKERAAVLGRVADLFRQNAADLAELTTLEMGKPITQAKGEVELSAAIFDYYATKGPDLLADEVLDIAGAGRAIVRTAPIGPLLGIMPWNFPYYQAARFIAPNLLLGNTILLKHAAICPQQALRLAELLDAAGAPEGVYQNVFATTEQVATMIASPLLQGVSLTGSERAGSAVGELAGRHFKKAVLELGGSDPFIVLPGADIGNAVSARGGGQIRQRGPGVHLVQTDDRGLLGLRRVPGRVRRQGRRVAPRRPEERRHPPRADGVAGGPRRSRRPGARTRSPRVPRSISAARCPTGPGRSIRRRCSPVSRRRCGPSMRSCSGR